MASFTDARTNRSYVRSPPHTIGPWSHRAAPSKMITCMRILKEIRLMGTVMSASYFIRRSAGGLACAGMLAFGLLLPAAAVAEDVKIGILFDVTGPLADSAAPALNAVKLAVDEINANGGILKGQTLKTIVADPQGTTQGSVDAASKL